MNNKGFAITGILYTVFVLFIMTLFAILTGLNTRLRLMQKSIISFEDDYSLIDANNLVGTGGITGISFSDPVPYTGKYVFAYTSGALCITYLTKGTSFTNATFIGDSGCKNAVQNGSANLVALYNFNKES